MSKRYDIAQEVMDTYNYAKFNTSKGTIWIKLYAEDAPNTVANLAHLAETGFYNGLKFHRVIDGFMAQGGCPNTAEGAGGMPGTGGPEWSIDCETDTAMSHTEEEHSQWHTLDQTQEEVNSSLPLYQHHT